MATDRIGQFQYRRFAPAMPALRPDGHELARHAVLIVGGGPVGLSLALGLARRGIRSVVFEADDAVCEGSRAACISRRSLEILDRLGVAQAFLGAPEVILHDVDGHKEEPWEDAVVDVPQQHAGKVIELLGSRQGQMTHMENHGSRTVVHFEVPSRGLIGMRTRILTATQGEAIFSHRFVEYRRMAGEIPQRSRGALINMENGQVTSYALDGLNDRGDFFTEVGDPAYVGQVVGEHCRDGDINVNAVRTKQLNNIRSSTKESFTKLKSRREMSLEEAMEWIEPDELVEVTPKAYRIRKRMLDENARKRAKKAAAAS